MANVKHVEIAKKGTRAIADWREGRETDAEPFDLSGAVLRGVDLRGADLRSANLRSADLSGAELSETDLRGADLRDAKLGETKLYRSDLRGVDLTDTDLRGANVADAILDTPLSRERVQGGSGIAETRRAHSESAVPPTRSAFPHIPGFRILREIGAGAMGTVFLAEQESPIRREVAVKVMRAAFADKELLARFDAERQALALMDHPGIARLFEAGDLGDGQPYFVMEFVAGTPVTEYCDAHALSVADRLSVFMQVCEGMRHAHQKGVIHRDLKPSNILVRVENGHAQAKVIDFGLAKAMRIRLTEKTLATEHGQVLGTPIYMSPEQALGDRERLDTRTDVYSLGAILYELLVGVTPFSAEELLADGWPGFVRAIREESPSPPSKRVSPRDGASRQRASRRGTTPAALAKIVRRELDWITMRALEKEPGHRYQSVSELLSDLGRYLRHEPVDAGPRGALYRVGKTLLRHKKGCALLVVLLALFVVGVYGLSAWIWQSRGMLLSWDGELLAPALDPIVVPDQSSQGIRYKLVVPFDPEQAAKATDLLLDEELGRFWRKLLAETEFAPFDSSLLSRAVRHEDGAVRACGVLLLGCLGERTDSTLRLLDECRSDPDPRVRAARQEALRDLLERATDRR